MNIGSIWWVRALFDTPRDPIFPSLPGDPPVPETLSYLALVALGFWTLVACAGLARARFGRVRRSALSSWTVRISIFCALAAVVTIASAALVVRERNFGRWADLKRELIAFRQSVRSYEAVHGVIHTQEQVKSFYAADPERHARTFSFTQRGPEVHLVYRIWVDPPQIMIIWDGGRSAGFDLDTMECVASD
jgi:hypothetical protein